MAFASEDSAALAAEADIPNMRIRQRQRKQDESPSASARDESQSTDAHSEMPSESSEDLSLEPLIPIDEAMTNLLQAESTQETFLVTLERPPSLVLVQQSRQNSHEGDEMRLEDVQSMPNSPTSALYTTPDPELIGSAQSDEDIVAISNRIEHQQEDEQAVNDTEQDAEAETSDTVHPVDLNGENAAIINVQADKDLGQDPQLESMASPPESHSLCIDLVSPDESDPPDKNPPPTPRLQPVKIIVRSRGSINSATTQEKMIPQTLLSTEAVDRDALVNTTAAEAKEAPLVRKSSFIKDIRQILSRKKSRSNIQEEATVTQTPKHQEMRRSRSLAALFSPSRRETRAQEPIQMTPTKAKLSPRTSVYTETSCQTVAPLALQCADKACETDGCIGEFITDGSMEDDPTVLQLIKGDLHGMEKVCRPLLRLRLFLTRLLHFDP